MQTDILAVLVPAVFVLAPIVCSVLGEAHTLFAPLSDI